jgi:hypothetical protein
MARSSRQEHPVSRFQRDGFTIYLKFGLSLEEDEPLIMVLVEVDCPVESPTQNLIDDDSAQLDKMLNSLTLGRSKRGIKEPTTA